MRMTMRQEDGTTVWTCGSVVVKARRAFALQTVLISAFFRKVELRDWEITMVASSSLGDDRKDALHGPRAHVTSGS